MPMILRKLGFCSLTVCLVFYVLSSFVLAEDRTELEEDLRPDKAATTKELAPESVEGDTSSFRHPPAGGGGRAG